MQVEQQFNLPWRLACNGGASWWCLEQQQQLPGPLSDAQPSWLPRVSAHEKGATYEGVIIQCSRSLCHWHADPCFLLCVRWLLKLTAIACLFGLRPPVLFLAVCFTRPIVTRPMRQKLRQQAQRCWQPVCTERWHTAETLKDSDCFKIRLRPLKARIARVEAATQEPCSLSPAKVPTGRTDAAQRQYQDTLG